MAGQSAMDYWESVLGARHIVLGKSHEALLEDYLALSTIFQRHGARVNAHSPTARIPAELLQHTFRLLRDIVERERSETPDNVHDSKADYMNGRPRPPIWSVVTRVCSRWRMIAHDDRFLWQDIRLLPIEPWVKHMLTLAKFSKLHVRARLPDDKKTGHILYALLAGRDDYASSHRISCLDISTTDGHYATKALYECKHLPSLERVTIRLDDEPGPYGTTRRELHWERFLARAPKLRSLSVSGYTLNGGCPRHPCTSLTRLSLSGGEKHRQLGLGPQMKAESLLRALECMPALQELILDDIVPLPAEAQAALLLRKRLSIQVAHVTFRHRDLRASLPFISVLSSLAIQLTLHTDRADETTLSTLLNHAPLKLPDPGFLSVSFSMVKEVLTVYVYFPPSSMKARHPQELILHLFDNRPPPGRYKSAERWVLLNSEVPAWPYNILPPRQFNAAPTLSLCVDDSMWDPRWRQEHWERLTSLSAKHIEAFNGNAFTLFSALAENPDAFPSLDDISVYDEDSSSQIWSKGVWDGNEYDGMMSLREPPFFAAQVVLRSVRLRYERGIRPFKRIMLPKRYLEDDWVAELRELVEVVEESQHGDHCHCHKVHDPYVDFSQT